MVLEMWDYLDKSRYLFVIMIKIIGFIIKIIVNFWILLYTTPNILLL